MSPDFPVSTLSPRLNSITDFPGLRAGLHYYESGFHASVSWVCGLILPRGLVSLRGARSTKTTGRLCWRLWIPRECWGEAHCPAGGRTAATTLESTASACRTAGRTRCGMDPAAQGSAEAVTHVHRWPRTTTVTTPQAFTLRPQEPGCCPWRFGPFTGGEGVGLKVGSQAEEAAA